METGTNSKFGRIFFSILLVFICLIAVGALIAYCIANFRDAHFYMYPLCYLYSSMGISLFFAVLSLTMALRRGGLTVRRISVIAGLCLLNGTVLSVLSFYDLYQANRGAYRYGDYYWQSTLSGVLNMTAVVLLIVITVILLSPSVSQKKGRGGRLFLLILFGLIGTIDLINWFASIITIKYGLSALDVVYRAVDMVPALTTLMIFALLLPTVISRRIQTYCKCVWFIPGVFYFTSYVLPALVIDIRGGYALYFLFACPDMLLYTISLLAFGFWYYRNYVRIRSIDQSALPVREEAAESEPQPVLQEPVTDTDQ